MSFVSHDLKCANGHLVATEIYRRKDGPPPCEVCGAAQSVTWFSGASPTFTGFGYVMVDGKEMTTSDLDARVKELEAKNPGKYVKVHTPSNSEIDARIDARKQRIADHRAKLGIDAQMMGEKQIEDLRKKREGLDRGRVKTADVHRDISKVEAQTQRVSDYTAKNT